MKTKKLDFKKETIVNLNQLALKSARGGTFYFTAIAGGECYTPDCFESNECSTTSRPPICDDPDDHEQPYP